MIGETPIIDPHTHVRCAQASAPDLASLMSYHWVQTELRAVGMPDSDADPKLPVDERVRRAIPYLRRMRNTAMAWCLFRIFRDLYDFDAPELTEANYRTLLDAVERTGRDPDWATSLLVDRCNIRTLVTSLGNRATGKGGAIGGETPTPIPGGTYFMLDAHYLFCPGVATDLEPFFVGRTTRGAYLDALHQLLDAQPGSSADLKRHLMDWLDRTVTGPVRFSNTFIPIEQRFVAPDNGAVDAVLTRAASGRQLRSHDDDIDTLVRFVLVERAGAGTTSTARRSRSPSGPSTSSAKARASRGSRRPGPARWPGRSTISGTHALT